MSLLFDEDYEKLEQRGFSWEEDPQSRFFIFKDYALPAGMYNVDKCDVLVVIPPNYNHGGNDMFWTYPMLSRKDGKAIPKINTPSMNDNRHYGGREFCRWSRHWHPNTSSAWRPGKDDIISIQRRIEWALKNPDA
jgi:hypothetical protein